MPLPLPRYLIAGWPSTPIQPKNHCLLYWLSIALFTVLHLRQSEVLSPKCMSRHVVNDRATDALTPGQA